MTPGDVIEVRGEGLWRIVCISGDRIEAIAHPWPASWAPPRTFDHSQIEGVTA